MVFVCGFGRVDGDADFSERFSEIVVAGGWGNIMAELEFGMVFHSRKAALGQQHLYVFTIPRLFLYYDFSLCVSCWMSVVLLLCVIVFLISSFKPRKR